MILVLALLAAVVTTALLRTGGGDGDLPERIVTSATQWLPTHRRSWGQAMVAELTAVQGRGRRWRFAGAAVWVATFPPVSRPRTVWTTAAAGLVATMAATLTVVWFVPTLSVFASALGLLLTGYATALAGRWTRLPSGGGQLVAGTTAVMAVSAATCAVVAVAIAHPAATWDRTHIASVALAAILCGYLVTALTAALARGTGRATRFSAVAVAGAATAAGYALPTTTSITPLIWPGTAVATLIAAVVVAALTRSRAAARRAGLLAALLGAPLHFATTLLALGQASPSTLKNAFDIAAFARSGYPDVASYLLGDALAGNIVSLAVTPVAMYLVAAGAAAVITSLPTGGRAGT